MKDLACNKFFSIHGLENMKTFIKFKLTNMCGMTIIILTKKSKGW